MNAGIGKKHRAAHAAIQSAAASTTKPWPKALLGAAAFATLALTAAPAAKASFTGFGDYSQFSLNQDDGAAAPTVGNNLVHLTGGVASECRSLFYDTPQSDTAFKASFTYTSEGQPTDGIGFGATFVLMVNPAGAHTVATQDGGGIIDRLGYFDEYGAYTHSAAVSLEYSSLSAGSSSTASYSGGNVGGGSSSTSPVNLFSGDPINVNLTYNGSLLQETLSDSVTGQSYQTGYLVNIPQLVGSSTAYVGFTANTSSAHDAADFSNFSYSEGVPEPASLSAVLLTMSGLLGRRRRLAGMR